MHSSVPPLRQIQGSVAGSHSYPKSATSIMIDVGLVGTRGGHYNASFEQDVVSQEERRPAPGEQSPQTTTPVAQTWPTNSGTPGTSQNPRGRSGELPNEPVTTRLHVKHDLP